MQNVYAEFCIITFHLYNYWNDGIINNKRTISKMRYTFILYLRFDSWTVEIYKWTSYNILTINNSHTQEILYLLFRPVEERNFVEQLTPFTLEMVPNWWYIVVIAGTLITYAETSTVRKSNNTLAVVRGNAESRIFTSF